ncbi:hypothetical protein [Nostoc linckia]|uniref:hypothetical protein n=1 Tax=Nostoc linckia TaxID=92942 RepID=UPI00117D8E91|nr:hypothetical protein [Nostoc linckia]
MNTDTPTLNSTFSKSSIFLQDLGKNDGKAEFIKPPSRFASRREDAFLRKASRREEHQSASSHRACVGLTVISHQSSINTPNTTND